MSVGAAFTMSLRTLCAGVLLLSVCLCFQLSAANRRRPTKGTVRLCCTEVSQADVSAQITGNVTIQKASGRCVNALIFPVKDKKVCVDPKAEWTHRLLAKKEE